MIRPCVVHNHVGRRCSGRPKNIGRDFVGPHLRSWGCSNSLPGSGVDQIVDLLLDITHGHLTSPQDATLNLSMYP